MFHESKKHQYYSLQYICLSINQVLVDKTQLVYLYHCRFAINIDQNNADRHTNIETPPVAKLKY